MAFIDIDVTKNIKTIDCWMQGEKNAEGVHFDISTWIETYGAGTAYIYIRRNGDETAYFRAMEVTDGVAEWLFSAADTAKAGDGRAQAVYITTDESVVKKTNWYHTVTAESEGDPTGEDPDPYKEMATEVIARMEEAEEELTGQALGEISDAKDEALEDIQDTMFNLAPEFVTTASYSAGDIVLYIGNLYEFTADHAAGAWIGTDARQITIGGVVADLKEDLSQLNQPISTRKINGYIDMATQTIVSDANSATYLFDISQDKTVVDYYRATIIGTNNRCRLLGFVTKIDNVNVGVYASYYHDFGNSTKEIKIAKEDYNNFNTIAITTNYQLTPVASINVTEHYTHTVWDSLSEQEAVIDGLQNSITYPHKGEVIAYDSVAGNVRFNEIPSNNCTVKAIGTNLFNYLTGEWGTIDPNTGLDDDSYDRSVRSEDYTPVVPGVYSVSCRTAGFYHLRLALYDENKTFIERIEKTYNNVTRGTITVPENGAKYARLLINYSVNHGDISNLKIMFSKGSTYPEFEEYKSNSVAITNGVVDGQLITYNGITTIASDPMEQLNISFPTNIAAVISGGIGEEEPYFTETECRERFRLEMTEKAKRLNMNDTIVGDGGGHPINTTITALDSIKMLCHAMSYQEIANTWSYDTKIIRTKGIVNTITMNSTLFTDNYISELTDYYTVLGFKTGSGTTHNLVCACTCDDLEGKVLVGCVILSQVEDTASVNRPKAMKTLMDMGKALVANRSTDISSYVSALTAMTATHFTVVLLPDCNTKLLQRYDFDGSYSLLYNHSSTTFTSWSMIKLLCAMTALDFMNNLDDANAVVYSDLLIGTGAYGPLFQEGEVITNRDALSALLIPSCNQAAYFLERVVGKKILEDYGEDGFIPTT